MTETQLQTKIATFACCSANLADKIATQLETGSCTDIDQLILLNGYITVLLSYKLDLDEDIENCITEEELEDIIVKGISICKICDCND